MTVDDLRKTVAEIPTETPGNTEIKVWLPGSLISLGVHIFKHYKGMLAIEGNIDRGSALDDL